MIRRSGLVLAPEPGRPLEFVDKRHGARARPLAEILVLAGSLGDGAELDDLLALLLGRDGYGVIASDLIERRACGEAQGDRLARVEGGA